MSVTKDFIRQPSLSSREIQQAISIANTVIETNPLLRPPRMVEQRTNAFAAWLEEWRSKFAPFIASALRCEAADVFADMPDSILAEVIARQIWPGVVPLLQSCALTYQAAEWGRKHLGDATTYYDPIQEGSNWRVPIGNVSKSDPMGQIVLDADGNVIESLTSTRAQLLEKIRDNQLSSAATVSGQ